LVRLALTFFLRRAVLLAVEEEGGRGKKRKETLILPTARRAGPSKADALDPYPEKKGGRSSKEKRREKKEKKSSTVTESIGNFLRTFRGGKKKKGSGVSSRQRREKRKDPLNLRWRPVSSPKKVIILRGGEKEGKGKYLSLLLEDARRAELRSRREKEKGGADPDSLEEKGRGGGGSSLIGRPWGDRAARPSARKKKRADLVSVS